MHYTIYAHDPISKNEEPLHQCEGFWQACDWAIVWGRWRADVAVIRKSATEEAVAAYHNGKWDGGFMECEALEEAKLV